MNTDLHGQICIFTTYNLCFIRVNPWLKNFSGRRDLNPRPLEGHSSALPSCATARWREYCFPLPRLRQTFPPELMKSAIPDPAAVSFAAAGGRVCSIGAPFAQSRGTT